MCAEIGIWNNVLPRVSWPPFEVSCGNPRIPPYTSPSLLWSDAFFSSTRPTANPAVWWSWWRRAVEPVKRTKKKKEKKRPRKHTHAEHGRRQPLNAVQGKTKNLGTTDGTMEFGRKLSDRTTRRFSPDTDTDTQTNARTRKAGPSVSGLVTSAAYTHTHTHQHVCNERRRVTLVTCVRLRMHCRSHTHAHTQTRAH